MSHKFEVAVFNQKVVDAMARGQKHRLYPDAWAENHYFEVTASTPDEAKRKIQVKYPEENGFVVAAVIPVGE